MSDWAKLLQDVASSKVQPIPKGWATCNQVAQQIGKSPSQTRRILTDAVEFGRCESKPWQVLSDAGKVQNTVIYRRK